MQKFKFILCMVIFSFTSVHAQDGLALLRVGQGAYQSGLAEAVVSVADQVDGSNYNPALMKTIKNFTASVGHTTYWENINLESGFYAMPLSKKIILNGGIRFATVSDLEKRTTPSTDPLNFFDYQDISFKTGITYLKSEKLSLGFAFGWLYEKNDIWSGSSMNIDLGMHYQVSPSLQIGAAVTNLGSSFQLKADGEVNSNDISLPTRYAVGGNYTYKQYVGAMDVVILDDELKLHLGNEAHIHEMFDIRAGYMFNYDSKNFTAGTTFKKRNIKIDYAFVPYSNSLGTSHLFNFTFSI